MKYILLIILLSSITAYGQNKNPKPKADTLKLFCDLNYFDRNWDSSNNVLKNDIDPEKNPIKVTSFYLGTKKYAVGTFIFLDNLGIFSVLADGYVIWCPYNYATGVIEFSYIVIDDKHTVGVRCYSRLVSKYRCFVVDSNDNCVD